MSFYLCFGSFLSIFEAFYYPSSIIYAFSIDFWDKSDKYSLKWSKIDQKGLLADGKSSKKGGLECTSWVLGSEFGSKNYNNLLRFKCKLLSCDPYNGQLGITQNPKTENRIRSDFWYWIL
jgi:hypothetical protein